jgi:hypothetical protein
MDADNELKASLDRGREKAGRIEDETVRREEARAAYHLKEDTTAKELVIIFRRTLQLLIDQGEREEIQLWAQPRIGRNSGLIYGWRIPDPIYTDYGSRHRALLDTGDIATISPGVKCRDAYCLMSIETWVREQVMCSRSEFHPDRPYQEARSDYYDLAFGRYAQQGNVEKMERQLTSIRRCVVDALGQMLSKAKVKPGESAPA